MTLSLAVIISQELEVADKLGESGQGLTGKN